MGSGSCEVRGNFQPREKKKNLKMQTRSASVEKEENAKVTVALDSKLLNLLNRFQLETSFPAKNTALILTRVLFIPEQSHEI